MSNLSETKQILEKYGQMHLLTFWDKLNSTKKTRLLSQVESIDFDLLAQEFKRWKNSSVHPNYEENITPLNGKSWTTFDVGEKAALANTGMRALREGKAASFVVAGGQGTRLGHFGPKGTLDIGLPSKKSLFQLQGERLLRLSEMCGKRIPWYIMTSLENHQATVDFFKEHSHFGHHSEDVFFFSQNEIPILDFEGNILLAGTDKISMGPDGNGGAFQALSKSGALQNMSQRGIEWVFLYSVDNALVRPCDPRFLGFSIHSQCSIVSKSVSKLNAQERVGVFCKRNEKPAVLEYSEIPEILRDAKTDSGTLVFDASNIATHFLKRNFIESQANTPLPYHFAQKKISFVNPFGELVNPVIPNALILEMFMFDLFSRTHDMAILNVLREEEFAPVKNPDSAGSDSPATSRALILKLHKSWAQSAGIPEIELCENQIEISPLTSYAGENLSKNQFVIDNTRQVMWA